MTTTTFSTKRLAQQVQRARSMRVGYRELLKVAQKHELEYELERLPREIADLDSEIAYLEKQIDAR